VVSQDATQDSGFELQYDLTDKRVGVFRARLLTPRPGGHQGARLRASDDGTWYHLVGVFDTSAGKNTMTLYVNGRAREHRHRFDAVRLRRSG